MIANPANGRDNGRSDALILANALHQLRGRAGSPLITIGQVQAHVYQGVVGAGDVGQVHADLTVLDLPEPPAPLPLDPDRGGPVLGKGGRVEHQHGVRLAQLSADLAGQFGHQRSVIPRGLADELLEGLSLLVVVVGDGLDVLARDAREQSLEVAACVVPLLSA